jgi:hypothetical protein
MKTTAIFIEQTIIGFIVLAICLLPVHSAIALSNNELSGHGDVFVAAAAVCVAYLLGIVFDRYADACAGGYERHLRARYAIELATWPEGPTADPFPEDRYRIQQLGAGTGVTEWFNYLRSTIRLARGLMVFVPGLTLAAVMATRCRPQCDVTAVWGYYILAAAYLGLPVISMVVGKYLFEAHAAPRTNELGELKEYAFNRGLINVPGKEPSAPRLTKLIDVVWSPSAVGGIIIFAAAIVLGSSASLNRNLDLVLTACGFAFTMLSAWAWATMQQTFMKYLHRSNKYGAVGVGIASAK